MELILASQSPRRRELMGLLFQQFEVQSPQVEETAAPGLAPWKLVEELAARKALAVAAGAAAIAGDDYYMGNCRRIMETRAYTTEQLDRRGFVTLPSLANFLFTSCPGLDGGELYRALKVRGVLVRWWDKPRLRPFVRVTIGTPEQMNVFLAALDDIREER